MSVVLSCGAGAIAMPSATTVTKGVRGDFGWTFWLLSTLMSTLAIVALARHAFVTWSLLAPMALVMDAYNATMQVLFGWAHPFLQATLTWLGSFIDWRLTLYPHWRDLFVGIAIGVVALARVFNVDTEDPGRGMRFGLIVLRMILAFLAALVIGMVPLSGEPGFLFIIVVVPFATNGIMMLLLGVVGLATWLPADVPCWLVLDKWLHRRLLLLRDRAGLKLLMSWRRAGQAVSMAVLSTCYREQWHRFVRYAILVSGDTSTSAFANTLLL
jgi:hypothetical protein